MHIRVEFVRGLQMFQSLFCIAGRLQQIAEVAVGGCELGISFDSFPVTVLCPIVLFGIFVGVPQVIPGFEIVGVAGHQFPKTIDCLFKQSGLLECNSEITTCFPMGRLRLQNRTECTHRVLMFSEFQQRQVPIIESGCVV